MSISALAQIGGAGATTTVKPADLSNLDVIGMITDDGDVPKQFVKTNFHTGGFDLLAKIKFPLYHHMPGAVYVVITSPQAEKG